MQEYIKRIEEVIAKGPFKDDWDSLSAYQPPRWFNRLKLGIFIHWGVYSVPAFNNEWYPRNMYIQGSPEYEHHRAVYGSQAEFGYKDFIPMFKAEKFDPDAWAELFADAGARYVVPVAEHHDGFQMYRSDISHWNAYEMGPKRDVLGELSASCGARGMVMGASSHRIEHWFFMGHGREFDSDIHEPLKRGDLYWPSMPDAKDLGDVNGEPAPSDEFLDDWMVRTCELIDRYQPRVLYFDWWIQHAKAKPWLKKIAAYYYNRAAEWGTEVVIAYKHDAFRFGCAMPDVERGQFAEVKPWYWQSDTAIATNSWCYTEGNNFKSPASLLQDLVDVVSKNGCMLLNVGPKSDGTISADDERVLRAIGAWLRANGEAIYDSRPWKIYGEGPTQVVEGQFSDGEAKGFTSHDFRFTVGQNAIYAIAMTGSEDGTYTIRAFGTDEKQGSRFAGLMKDVTIPGSDAKVEWTRDGAGLHLRCDCKGDMPVVFKLLTD